MTQSLVKLCLTLKVFDNYKWIWIRLMSIKLLDFVTGETFLFYVSWCFENDLGANSLQIDLKSVFKSLERRTFDFHFNTITQHFHSKPNFYWSRQKGESKLNIKCVFSAAHETLSNQQVIDYFCPIRTFIPHCFKNKYTMKPVFLLFWWARRYS